MIRFCAGLSKRNYVAYLKLKNVFVQKTHRLANLLLSKKWQYWSVFVLILTNKICSWWQQTSALYTTPLCASRGARREGLCGHRHQRVKGTHLEERSGGSWCKPLSRPRGGGNISPRGGTGATTIYPPTRREGVQGGGSRGDSKNAWKLLAGSKWVGGPSPIGGGGEWGGGGKFIFRVASRPSFFQFF